MQCLFIAIIYSCKWNLENRCHVDNQGGYAGELVEKKQHPCYTDAPEVIVI